MTHVRAQIREAFAARLTGLTTTGPRVYAGRTRPLAKDHDPALLVYATEETSDVAAMGAPATATRALTVMVEGRVSGSAPPDETLDAIAAEVETAIGANWKAGGLAKEVTLVATRLRAQAPGESQLGEVALEFRVSYRTREGAPETAV